MTLDENAILSGMDDDWGKAEAREDGTADDVPDGSYHAQVHSAEFGTSERSGNYLFKIRFDITAGESKGRPLFRNFVLVKNDQPNTATLPVLKDVLAKLGLKLSKLSELRAKAGDLVGKCAELQVRTNKKNDWRDVIVVRGVSSEIAGTSPDPAPSAASAGSVEKVKF